MPAHSNQNNVTSNVLAWTAHAVNATEEDAGADTDEPPDQSLLNNTAAAQQQHYDAYNIFQKTIVRRPREHTESLLTRALQSQSEDEVADRTGDSEHPRRRRSITSNTSMASTADFTSDTGITTPRTNSPSPRLVGLGFAPVPVHQRVAKKSQRLSTRFADPDMIHQADSQDLHRAGDITAVTSQAEVSQKKPCISFACAFVKPPQHIRTSDKSLGGSSSSPAADDVQTRDITPRLNFARLETPPRTPQEAQPKRQGIRFACPARPVADTSSKRPTVKVFIQDTRRSMSRKHSPVPGSKSPASVRKLSPTSFACRSPRASARPSVARQTSNSPLATRRTKYYNAEPSDLDGESSRFHEFASDAPLEDDWIRHGHEAAVKQRLTIDDTLQKELAIRRLGKEAEEEAEQEEQDVSEGNNEDDDEADAEGVDDGDDNNDDDEDDDDNDNDGADENETVDGDVKCQQRIFSGYTSGGSASDGYNTDNEIGFASSDDEDDGLVLWTVNRSTHGQRKQNIDTDHSTLHQNGSPIFRRLSIDEHSDSSGFIAGRAMRQEKPKNRELPSSIRRPETPELPDSTDFVCGTFDEDRLLEDAYMSHMEARKRGKVHVIPQDIDPSFPTSDPEEDSEMEAFKYDKRMQQQRRQHRGSADERFWEVDDFHDQHHQTDHGEQLRSDVSPRRYHSPPPKGRGRSPAPRRMVDGQKVKCTAPKAVPVPIAQFSRAAEAPLSTSPAGIVDKLAFQALALQPGLAHSTTSLPRPSAIFRHQHSSQQVRTRTQPQPQLHNTQSKPYRRPKANSTASAKQPRHVRGAIDIVKGLEQKRQRRKEKFHQRYCDRARKGHVTERRPQRGEGAERMREVGLLMAGKIGQGNYVLSV